MTQRENTSEKSELYKSFEWNYLASIGGAQIDSNLTINTSEARVTRALISTISQRTEPIDTWLDRTKVRLASVPSIGWWTGTRVWTSRRLIDTCTAVQASWIVQVTIVDRRVTIDTGIANGTDTIPVVELRLAGATNTWTGLAHVDDIVTCRAGVALVTRASVWCSHLVAYSILTWRGDAWIENTGACLSRVLSRTRACIAGESTSNAASSSILTWIGGTVVDSSLTTFTSVLQVAGATVAGRSIDANTAVQAWRNRATVVDLNVAKGACVAWLAGALESSTW